MHDYMIIAFENVSGTMIRSVGICHICWVAVVQTVTSPILVPPLVRSGWHQKTNHGDKAREMK